GRGLGIDALLGADFDLLDLLHDLRLAEVEVDGRHRRGVHLDGLDLLVEADRLDLDLDGPDRNAGNHVVAVLVRHRALAGTENDHVREGDGLLSAFGDLAGNPAGGARRSGGRW